MTEQGTSYGHTIRPVGLGFVIEWTVNVPDEMDRIKPVKFKKRTGLNATRKFAQKHGLEVPERSAQ